MANRFLSETVGKPGLYSFLDQMVATGQSQTLDIVQQLRKDCAAEVADFEELFETGLLLNHDNRISVSTSGHKATLLLRAINGADDLTELVNKLVSLFPYIRQYHLIQGNVTEYVVDTINARRDFIRLYICSPWIRLREPYYSRLAAAVEAARLNYPSLQFLVITLPMDRYNDAHAIKTVQNLKALGATVMTNRKLHAKLYISEPGPLGGSQYAILGSENLTGANQIELAVKVENENEMIGRLTNFFFDIERDSVLL